MGHIVSNQSLRAQGDHSWDRSVVFGLSGTVPSMSTTNTKVERPRPHKRGVFGRRAVDCNTSTVWKFFPSLPPQIGEIVIVDDVRCKVSWVRVRWGKEQNDLTRKWTLKRLIVKSRPA